MLDLSLAHELADPGRRDALAIDTLQRHRRHAEAVGRAKLFEQRGVADCSTPEAEVLADHDPDDAQRSDERLLDELGGLQRGQLGVEADDQELVRLLLGDQRRSLVERGERQRCCPGAQPRGHRVEVATRRDASERS